jgi:hypothetical protein
MDLSDSQATSTSQRTRPEKPPPCVRCAGECWWNGWRRVFPRLAASRVEMWLARIRCKGSCPDFVLRPGNLYPHRQYQPDAVAEVVGAIALGGEVPGNAAAQAEASATSARRWTAWVAQLAEVGALLSWAQRLDPDAAAGTGISAVALAPPRALAARVLHALEQLGTALLRRGVNLVSKSGLGRVLEWQHKLHGDVVHLVTSPRSFSPPMALGGAPVGP